MSVLRGKGQKKEKKRSPPPALLGEIKLTPGSEITIKTVTELHLWVLRKFQEGRDQLGQEESRTRRENM